jgi:succinate dehydrogenase / fumarate reductase cytochrome b subunit
LASDSSPRLHPVLARRISSVFSGRRFKLFYVVAMVIVAVHVSHGFWSLFQTFGLNHPCYMPLIMKLGLVVTFVFGSGLGFCRFIY